MTNIRKQTLDEAEKMVNGQRTQDYGTPEDSFNTIAALWGAYNRKIFSSADVAIMLALLKIARLKADKTHKDSWVDLAGYAACGAECALPKQEGTRQYGLMDDMDSNRTVGSVAGNQLYPAVEAKQMASVSEQLYPSNGHPGLVGGSVLSGTNRSSNNVGSCGGGATNPGRGSVSPPTGPVTRYWDLDEVQRQLTDAAAYARTEHYYQPVNNNKERPW